MDMKSSILMLLWVALGCTTVFAVDDACNAPLTAEERADHWVACDGIGKNKDSAVDNAVKRAVAMVYGQVISAEDKMESSSSETNVQSPQGNVSVESTRESVDSKMETKTAGFVREYKVISAEPDGSDFRAHIHARIINPRAGVDAVILVMRPEASIELQSDLVKIGPKRTVSGKEICGVAEKALCGALSGSRRFKVCTMGDIAAAAKNNALTGNLVSAGMVPSSELLQTGQMLTCDFVLATRVEKIAYSKKLGQDKKTKKFGQVQSMKIVLSFQLTNVRTGASAGSDTVTLFLNNEEIREMLAADEDADLLRGTFNALVQPLRGWIKKNAK